MTIVKRFLAERGRGTSPVGFGCMSFGGMYGPTTEAESLGAMRAALDLGVTFWDTANVYGDGVSETLIGRFFDETPGARGRVMLASKFAIARTPEGKRRIDNSRAHMRESLDASLKRLRTDHIDLYYLHRFDPAVPIEETVGHMADEVKAGRIGAIGLSEIAPDTLRRAAEVHPIAAVQSEYSLWSRAPELGLIQACAELGALFVAFSPVGRGYFGGEPIDPASLPASDFRASNPRFLGRDWQRNLARREPFLALAASWGVAPAALAIAWTMARGDHVVPIPGTRSAEHLVENASAAKIELTTERLAEIERILPAGFAAGERYSPAQWMNIERYG